MTDDVGALLDASGDIDGDAVGAIHVVATQALGRCGSVLGLGALDRVTITGPKRACLLTGRDHDVLGVYIDPSKLGAFETKLETVLRR